MRENISSGEANVPNEQSSMSVVYRHDVHKLAGISHRAAPDTLHGVPVNQSVPLDADTDAAAMSRPSGTPRQTMDNHQTRYRLSLFTGKSIYGSEPFIRSVLTDTIDDLLTTEDEKELHQMWLTSDVVSWFNESIYYPYTSLKYHTLLVAALLDNYRAGHDFDDLLFVVDDADTIVPHRTIYAGERFALRIAPESNDQPWARLGSRPWQSWASTWTRLTRHPLDTADDKYDMVLDANLRRIRSWSTALQYIEEFEQWGDRP